LRKSSSNSILNLVESTIQLAESDRKGLWNGNGPVIPEVPKQSVATSEKGECDETKSERHVLLEGAVSTHQEGTIIK
jgi:hypothetical protein